MTELCHGRVSGGCGNANGALVTICCLGDDFELAVAGLACGEIKP